MANEPTDLSTLPQLTEERLAALPPEGRSRILVAMRMYSDLNDLHREGVRAVGDLLEGKASAADVVTALTDFERSLSLAASGMLKRPLQLVHAEAVRKGETALDEGPWLSLARIRAAVAARNCQDGNGRE